MCQNALLNVHIGRVTLSPYNVCYDHSSRILPQDRCFWLKGQKVVNVLFQPSMLGPGDAFIGTGLTNSTVWPSI